MSWEITMVNLGLREKKQLAEANRLAAEGWEPFAATYNQTSGHTIFLRRSLGQVPLEQAPAGRETPFGELGKDFEAGRSGIVETPGFLTDRTE